MRLPLALLILALLTACDQQAGSGDPFPLPTGSGAEEWTLHGYGYGEQRFSPLDNIDADNVDNLGLAFTFDDFVVRGRTHRGVQATPIMADGMLYFTGPWSVAYAVNARTGKLAWHHDPEVDGGWVRHACCDAVNRGLALRNGTLYLATLDGWLEALDAKTGKRKWRVDTFTNRSASYTITGAPRIAGNLIVIGNGGAEMGVRGYVSAYHADSGKLAWRFFTIPGAGADEHPEVALARKTWSAKARWDLGGGGTVWDSMTYDPALNILYLGVGNGGPWPGWIRNGGKRQDNLYLSSIVALDASTGRLKWHYQTTPGDSWDYTASQNMILADIDWKGSKRHVIMQAPKNGFFYVLDRKSGELLLAEKYTETTWASHVDMRTGRPVETRQADYSGVAKAVWPSTAGGHNWQPMAYSPQTALVYIPVLEMPMKFESQPAQAALLPGANNVGAKASPPASPKDARLLAGQPPFRQQAFLKAIDPLTGKVRWQTQPMPWWNGGVLVTGGGLVFQGSADGIFRAFDARTGKVLKDIPTGLAIMAPPITYSLDGEQYLAVLAGLGGAMNGRYMKGFAAHQFENRERLFVFKLGGGKVSMPPQIVRPTTYPPMQFAVDPKFAAHGQKLFMQYCARCHAPGGAPNGYPNLWNMSPETLAAFDQIVLDGAFSYAGMARFDDVLNPHDTKAIKAFIAADRAKSQMEKSRQPEAASGH